MRFFICNLVALLVLTTTLRADTVYISSGGNPIPYANVKVLKIAGGQIVYNLASGTQTQKPLEQVVRMQIDGEPAFNAAEQAFADEKWDAAVDGYLKTARATNKPWLKEYASLKLLTAAQKTRRFDAAATAYINTLLSDPDTAAKYKPQLPESGSTFIDGAISEATAALNTSSITDRQKLALLGFLLDLERAKKDHAGEDRVLGQIDEILAKDPTNPAAGQAIARRSLAAAQRALDSKDYPKAISEIEAANAKFVDPSQQADALYILGEAKYTQAGAKKDANDLKDAALAYMRVVANFKDMPNHPHVPESLLKTATIEEQLNDTQAAQLLYQQIAQQYPNDPVAAVAKQKMKK